MKKLLSLVLALCMALAVCASASALEIQDFPAVPEDYSKVVDPADPLKTIYSGAYRVAVSLDAGEGADQQDQGSGAEVTSEVTERSAVVYLAESYAQTQGFIMVVPATGTTPEQALEEGGWQAVADEYGLYLMVLDTTDAPVDAACLTAAATLADSRDYWRQPEGRNYIVAYGDNVDAALLFTESMLPSTWAGIACFGATSVSDDDLIAANANGVELPVWLFTDDLTDEQSAAAAVLAVYNDCADSEALYLADGTLVMTPNQQTTDMLLNDQPMSQLRITVAADAAALNADRAAQVYAWLKLGTREVGYGDKAMRYTHELSDWGATMEYIEIDGITRSYVQYIPSTASAGNPVPVVVCLHGSALNGEYFAERTGFIRLAEEFGFIALFPTGSITTGITPQWNYTCSEDNWDDVTFIKTMVDTVAANYPVDTSRLYVYGHSLGGMFTQRLINYLPGYFAAAAGTGCTLASILPEETLSVQTPIFVLMGENDLFGTSFSDDQVQTFVNYFTASNGCSADKYIAYRTGRYQNYVYTNEDGVPMVRYSTVDDKPHTATLDEGMYIYEFLSQFSRGEDGSVIYGGGVTNAR